MTIARYFVIGKQFGYSDKEIWHSTPRKLAALFVDYRYFRGEKKKKVTIDTVIPF